jgi:hypothetical protein
MTKEKQMTRRTLAFVSLGLILVAAVAFAAGNLDVSGDRARADGSPTEPPRLSVAGDPGHIERPNIQAASLQTSGLSSVGHVERDCFALSQDSGLLYGACGAELVVFDLFDPTMPSEVGALSTGRNVFQLPSTVPPPFSLMQLASCLS